MPQLSYNTSYACCADLCQCGIVSEKSESIPTAQRTSEPRCGIVNETRLSTKSGTGPSDAALVIAARARESWAEQALFARHAAWVLSLAQRMLGRAEDAEELLQDAFVRAFGHLHELDNPQAFAAWLSTLAVRLAQKRLRRQRMFVRLGLRSNDSIDVEGLIASNAPPDVACELSAIYSIISDMSAQERIALVLRRVEGMELAEVAERMQLSVATVKRRLSSAEARLRRFQDHR